ncbi:MAG TPA: Glu/Leu/Phe/Val dehydrogenase dimerization domain-containing protein [Longimicrobiales bacterium]|nr:Glu/Leu/Phe/Val dehydrogenase dimerization domain-containing protein [Longimicrobiales bacterium]
MWSRYSEFLRTAPELTVDWRDPATGARGWLVINSLRGGAAGGGTRMRIGVTPGEVTYLAKTMELKFALAGPPIGGAKAGIDFDPHDPRKAQVLRRWYRAISPYLRACYGTGGDLNVDELLEVIPYTAALGLRHPQEGVVRGHFHPDEDRFGSIIRMLDEGVKAPLTNGHGVPGLSLTVADAATGWGVAASVRHLHQHLGVGLDGARVLLEGFGNVGAACALYLTRAGARVIGITDAEKALLAPEGLDVHEVEDLIRRRVDRLLPGDDPRIRRGADAQAFWRTPADVFVCAALSGSVTEQTLDALGGAGVRVIACGANQPFREEAIGDTRVTQMADSRFAVLADFLSNCGMARTFSYLMEPGPDPCDTSIFGAIDSTIRSALEEVFDRSDVPTRGLFSSTLAVSLDRIATLE